MNNHVNSGIHRVEVCQNGITKILAVAILSTIVLGGCTKTEKTVEYYKENAAEMQKTLDVCNNNPGTFIMRPECKNVTEAKKKIEIEKSRDKWDPERGMAHWDD